MRRPRRRPRVAAPPIPRVEPDGRRAEAEFFDELFAQSLWRRPTPL